MPNEKLPKGKGMKIIVKIRCKCNRGGTPVWIRIRAAGNIYQTGDKLIATEPCWNCKRTVRMEANNPSRIQCSVEEVQGFGHFVQAEFNKEFAEWDK